MKIIALLLMALLLCNGCATMVANQIAQRANPIRVDVNGREVVLGVDLFSLKAVGKHPMLHGAAAITDAVLIGLAVREADRRWGCPETHVQVDNSVHYWATTGDNSPVYQGQPIVGNTTGGE